MYIICMLACLSVCAPHECSGCGGHRRVQYGAGVAGGCVSSDMGAEIGTQPSSSFLNKK